MFLGQIPMTFDLVKILFDLHCQSWNLFTLLVLSFSATGQFLVTSGQFFFHLKTLSQTVSSGDLST